MKKLLFLLAFLLASVLTFAQIHLSCDRITLYAYNEASRDFDVIKSEEKNTVFEVTNNIISHTTPTMKSAYYVTSNEENENGDIECRVTSDVGNKYLCVISIRLREIQFFYKSEDQSYIVVYDIKSHW